MCWSIRNYSLYKVIHDNATAANMLDMVLYEDVKEVPSVMSIPSRNNVRWSLHRKEEAINHCVNIDSLIACCYAQSEIRTQLIQDSHLIEPRVPVFVGVTGELKSKSWNGSCSLSKLSRDQPKTFKVEKLQVCRIILSLQTWQAVCKHAALRPNTGQTVNISQYNYFRSHS